jgi:SAM-dependent methyltransferase
MADAHADQLAMYTSLAGWFHLVTAPAEYDEEAAFVLRALRDRADGTVVEALELGCGGGNLASHLKHDLRLTLTDLSPEMLAVSSGLNPGCEHVLGDMRTLRLDRTFDAVVLHDAVMYMTSEDDLRAAMTTAWAHLRAGGAVVLLPDCVRETLRETTEHGGHDGDGRALRYVEWVHDPDPEDTTYVTDFAYILHEAGSPTRVVPDRHVLGVFPRDAWVRLLREAGFDAGRIATIPDPWGRDVFVATR